MGEERKAVIALKLVYQHVEPEDEDDECLSAYGPLPLDTPTVPRVGENVALSIRRYDVSVPVKYTVEIIGIEHHFVDGVQIVGLLAVPRLWDDGSEELHDPMFHQWLPPEEQTGVPQSRVEVGWSHA